MCEKWFNETVGQLRKNRQITNNDPAIPRTLKGVLAITTLNRYSQNLDYSQVGVNRRDWAEVQNGLEGKGVAATLGPSYTQIFLGDRAFYEASPLGRLAFRQSIDLAGVLVHEFFHGAGYERGHGYTKDKVRELHKGIQAHCGRPDLVLD